MAPLGGGRVAYLGGSFASATGNAPFSSAVAYDAKSDSWAQLPDMQLPRDAPGACTLGGSLFAFGGAIAFPTPPSSQMTITNSVESLDLFSSSPTWAWGWAAPLPSNRTSPSVTALVDGSKCVIAGGFSGVPVAGGAPTPGYLDDAYLFDGTSYSALPQLPFGRSNMGIAATSAGVYVIGGGAMDPSYFNVSFLAMPGGTPASAWEAVAPLNYARSWAMVATIGEAIVVAGGMSLEPMFQPMGSVEVYANGSWTLFSDGLPGALPGIAVGFGSGAALNATHMLCGGGAGQGVDGTEAFLFKLP